MIKAEQVVEFLKNNNAGAELAELAHKKLTELNLPKSMTELEDDDVLDEQLDNNLAFHFSNGEDSEDVVICGYETKSQTLLVQGFGHGITGDIFSVSLAELELYNLLEIVVMLSI